ncbi:MAG: LacI family DNA-binding transcriptional regulator [Eubacteriales bacterium]|nr:LacI family DNA-binding transcriptional regulator [Eubacteriales bacterium]
MSTIFDVARHAGVSKSTVSRVLNGEKGVKEETRLAVEKAISELRYTPSYLAQGIRTGKTKTIAMVVPEYTNIFYNEMFRGVEDVALESGYMVFVCNTERSRRSEIEYTREILKRNVDGIIYNTYSNTKEMKEYLIELSQKVPVVFTNKIFGEQDDVSYVYTDGFASNRKAVHYLYEKGRYEIGYIRNTSDISVIEDRFEGYCQGLSDCGIPYEEKYVYRVKQTREPDYIKLGQEAARYYESLPNPPRAIIAAIDALAIGCVQQLQRDGVMVPGDMSVIGFDNIALSSLIQPPLTTISQPIRRIGQKAAEIVISKIDGKEVEDKIVFDGNLILRETTE